MDLPQALGSQPLVLTEAAVLERLRRTPGVRLHPRLEHALLLYEPVGRAALEEIYRSYLALARDARVPMAVATPTWRANRERLAETGVREDVNGDAVRYLRALVAAHGPGPGVAVGALLGCRHDCYEPAAGLTARAARDFHGWQVERLAAAGPDYLLAATLPAVPEALGIAQAAAATGLPYLLSFTLDRHGRVRDGTPLERACAVIDAACPRPPLGYLVNCAHPGVLLDNPPGAGVRGRLLGFQGNASRRDPGELDGAASLQVDDIGEWAGALARLRARWDLTLLGGCCGTGPEHLRALLRRVAHPAPAPSPGGPGRRPG